MHRHTMLPPLSPVLLLSTAAWLSLGAVAGGPTMWAGDMSGVMSGGEPQGWCELVEAIAATACAIADDDAPVTPAGPALTAPALLLETPGGVLALALSRSGAGTRTPLQWSLTSLPPPGA